MTSQETLAQFLREADSPRDRAFVMALMDITATQRETVKDLIANTAATQRIAVAFDVFTTKDFPDHVISEQTTLAKVEGAYAALTKAIIVVGALITVIVTLAGYIANTHLSTLAATVSNNAAQDTRLTVLETNQHAVMVEIENIKRMLNGAVK